MPTILTHAALPLIAAWAAGPKRIPPILAAVGGAVAVLPDLDVIGRGIGVSVDSLWGHRGISHSVGAAAAMATLGGLIMSAQMSWRRSMPFLFIAALSHGLTDMLTDGGKGIALLWPFSEDRLFASFRPIEVSPILLRGLENGKLPFVLASELIWLVGPALLFALLVRLTAAHHIDSYKGQS